MHKFTAINAFSAKSPAKDINNMFFIGRFWDGKIITKKFKALT
jgi:hypothetical protein